MDTPNPPRPPIFAVHFPNGLSGCNGATSSMKTSVPMMMMKGPRSHPGTGAAQQTVGVDGGRHAGRLEVPEPIRAEVGEFQKNCGPTISDEKLRVIDRRPRGGGTGRTAAATHLRCTIWVSSSASTHPAHPRDAEAFDLVLHVTRYTIVSRVSMDRRRQYSRHRIDTPRIEAVPSAGLWLALSFRHFGSHNPTIAPAWIDRGHCRHSARTPPANRRTRT